MCWWQHPDQRHPCHGLTVGVPTPVPTLTDCGKLNRFPLHSHLTMRMKWGHTPAQRLVLSLALAKRSFATNTTIVFLSTFLEWFAAQVQGSLRRHLPLQNVEPRGCFICEMLSYCAPWERKNTRRPYSLTAEQDLPSWLGWWDLLTARMAWGSSEQKNKPKK